MAQFNEFTFMNLLLRDKYGANVTFSIEKDGKISNSTKGSLMTVTMTQPAYVMIVKDGDAIIAKSDKVGGYNKNYWKAEGFFELYKTLQDVV